MQEVDNQSGGDAGSFSAQDGQSDLTQQSGAGESETSLATEVQKYQPFATGKEKFKIDGNDEELDWEATKKYASLGKTAYKRMQEAAEIRNQSQKAYKELLELAQKDPDGLIRALNPNYAPQLQRSPQGAQQRDQVTDKDPRDLELHEVKQEMQQMKSLLEKQEIEQERKLIDQELTEASEKYPALKNNRFNRDFIKQEYRKALQAGMNVTIDDVAFYVSQELQADKNQKTQETKQRLEQKRKQAPVNVVTAGSESASKGMSLDDVKKLAGRG